MTLERERENPSERIQEPWITVCKKRKTPPRPPPSPASQTIYIDFLPANSTPYDVSNIFFPYDIIETISVPEKLRANCSHRYAFVKYHSPLSVQPAIKAENGRRIGPYSLRVRPAKRDKPTPKPKPTPIKYPPPYSPKPQSTNPTTVEPITNHTLRDSRSYKEASIPPPLRRPKTKQNLSTLIQYTPRSSLPTSYQWNPNQTS